jgi:nucleotide-binding universal stress UspA family protein
MAVSVRASVPRRPRLAYRRILVPLDLDGGSGPAVSAACRLAADQGATVTALVVIRVPSELPLDAHMLADEARAKRLLAEAEAIGDQRGVTVERRVARARAVGEAIVEMAEAAVSELIVLHAPRVARRGARRPVFGRSAQFVLAHARCRVLLTIPAGR